MVKVRKLLGNASIPGFYQTMSVNAGICRHVSIKVRFVWLSSCFVLAPYKTAPHNRYQPHPAEPAQHNTCSNIRLVLLKMGIMMPKTCWEIVKNKHLTVHLVGFLSHSTRHFLFDTNSAIMFVCLFVCVHLTEILSESLSLEIILL